jgi:hypothetical protein
MRGPLCPLSNTLLSPWVFFRRRKQVADTGVEELFANLKLLKVFDLYHTHSLNREQQSWLRLICSRYLIAPPLERIAINSLVTPNISFLCFIYAPAMAIESGVGRDEVKALQGLLSLSTENETFDWRDSLMVLNLLYHSATKIGADAVELFRRVAVTRSLTTGREPRMDWSSIPLTTRLPLPYTEKVLGRGADAMSSAPRSSDSLRSAV